MSGLLTALAGANLIYGLGMLELGMTFSYSQLLIDNDIANMIKKVVQGIEVSDESMAVDVIKQVGAGGDFLMQDHTIRHMKTAQSRPKLFDRRMRDAWLNQGGKDVAQIAQEEAVYLLQNHKPEPLPPGVAATLKAIVEAGEEELGEKKK
ncbi:MAG: trimethylamine methyltransferase family protein [Clostridia bacterium]|jgi:trimethylamine--corrinoid protein Co-methyltransferase|nr:trimethylamine methyltransferase family protein [Clostridia bacterium]